MKVRVIDSHTAGEPTRVVIEGAPDLGHGTMAERRTLFAERFDAFRSAVVCEPRGFDAMVGALLCEPVDPTCCAGVIFFNNVGVLNMCGHGTIGLAVTLAHLGRINAGIHQIETSVGIVQVELHDRNTATIENVPSYRKDKDHRISVNGIGDVCGDIAWGGNWFYLIEQHGQELSLSNVDRLTDYCWRVRQALNLEEIDHIELFGAAHDLENSSRNFVLCPGKAYDRSPCGTGTSAKLACMFADGTLKENQIWKQESIIGSVFEGSVRIADGKIIPRIKGQAFITAESTLVLDDTDPFRSGIRS